MPRGKGTKGTNQIKLLCLLCLFAACRSQPSADIRITHEVVPEPPRVGQATITLRVTDSSGALVNGARIKLEGNMTHSGMAPVFADAAEFERGRYRANMELTMAGDWIVVVHVTLPDNRKLDQQFDIKGVAPA